ncbi:MAG: hypothetical protein AB1758_33480, partial [Candidatus Eremiobacterota bacterium]
MSELFHEWGYPRRVMLQDATLTQATRLSREQQLDYLALAAALGIQRVEVPPHPIFLEECQALGLEAVCPTADAQDVRACQHFGVLARVPASVALAVPRQPLQITLNSVAQLPPHRLSRYLAELGDLSAELCLEDEVGEATVEGTERLLGFVELLQIRMGKLMPLTWSQRDVSGMGIFGALRAVATGCVSC